jgi:hypothetical protein
MPKTLLLLPVFVFMFISCKVFEPLSLNKQDYRGNNLKTDGYYYIFKDKEEGFTLKEKKYNTFFIYRNGIYFGGKGLSSPTFDISNLDSLDLSVKKKVINVVKYEPLQYEWGVFKVNGSEIVIERWVTASGGGIYPTQILKGEIKNDTTINFHTLVGAHPVNYNRKKKILKIDETYHFRQMSPKPDSTNKFIK